MACGTVRNEHPEGIVDVHARDNTEATRPALLIRRETTHADRLTRHIRRARSGQWRTATGGSLSSVLRSKQCAPHNPAPIQGWRPQKVSEVRQKFEFCC